jgi:acyl-coenzyme A thioesterase PaaI-like protein
MPDATTIDAFYQLDGAIAVPSVHTRGPWDPNAQHGGAPTALIAWTADNLPAAAPMRLARLTVDLFRPVPIAPIEIRTEILREGRNIQVAGVSLVSNGKECVRASALRIRDAQLEIPPESAPPALRWPKPDDCPAIGDFGRDGLARTLEIRLASEAFHAPGGSAVWFRLTRPFISGADTTPLMRACVAADFCNGMSGALDFMKWTFINADLSVHFARPPAGEWMLLEARGWIGSDGRGVAFGDLADETGVFGRATQSLVIAPR